MNDRDRAYRRAQRKRIIDNRVNFLRETKQQHILEVCEPGRMDDRHPMDCGGTCMMCHGDKLLNKGARRAEQNREWQRHYEQGEGAANDGHDAPDYDWRVLRSDDVMDGLPSAEIR